MVGWFLPVAAYADLAFGRHSLSRSTGRFRINTMMNQDRPGQIVCAELRNRFWLLRHGQSAANQAGLIASSPEVAVSQFGLTTPGQDQVASSVEQHEKVLGDVTQIFTSDFRRTRETAQIAARLLNAPVEETMQLRERHFGEWDGKSDEHYQAVWSADAEAPTHQQWQVESVAAVALRMSQFIRTVDQSGVDQTFLIVSHGDPLQILLTAASGRDLRLHRQMKPLSTAELRLLCHT